MKKLPFSCGFIGLCVLLVTGCTRIRPDEIGVRTLNFGDGMGIVAQDYAPGYHRYIWPLDTWHRFPSTVQQIRFARATAGPFSTQTHDALQVTSAGGDRVAVTADVFFRIAEDAGHRVLQDAGPDDRYFDVVRNLAQEAARVVFGRLKTEDFYDEAKREQARQAGVALLRERLEPRGIALVDVLVQTVEFEPNYEALIKQKKIADQRVELEKAKARAAAEKGKVARIQAETTAKTEQVDRETDARIMEMNAETELTMAKVQAEAARDATQRRADADLYITEQQAAGQRLILLAEAEGTRRLNQALVGDGSANVVALEALKKLNLSEVTFSSDGFDWFNPREMARRVGASETSSSSKTETATAPK